MIVLATCMIHNNLNNWTFIILTENGDIASRRAIPSEMERLSLQVRKQLISILKGPVYFEAMRDVK